MAVFSESSRQGNPVRGSVVLFSFRGRLEKQRYRAESKGLNPAGEYSGRGRRPRRADGLAWGFPAAIGRSPSWVSALLRKNQFPDIETEPFGFEPEALDDCCIGPRLA